MSFILELIIGKVSISLLINLIVQSLIKSSRLLENLKINKFDINYNFKKRHFVNIKNYLLVTMLLSP
jgi:hypothetical protein